MWYKLSQKHLGKGDSYEFQASPTELNKVRKDFFSSGNPAMVNFQGGQGNTLIIHGSNGPDGRVWFQGPNGEGFAPEQLETWMQSQGYPINTPVIACGLGAPITLPSGKVIQPMFDYQGTYEASVAEDPGSTVLEIKAV